MAKRIIVNTRPCTCEAWPFCEHAPNAKKPAQYRIEILDRDTNERGATVYFWLYTKRADSGLVPIGELNHENEQSALMLDPDDFEDFAKRLEAEVKDFSDRPHRPRGRR